MALEDRDLGRLISQSVQTVDDVFRLASRDITQVIQSFDATPTEPQRRMMMRQIDGIMDRYFGSTQAKAMQSTLYREITGMMQRAASLPYARMAQRFESLLYLTGPHVTAARAARAAMLDPNRAWVNGDRYRLSDRVWKQGKIVRGNIDDVIRDGIRHGRDSVDIARDLEQYLNPDHAPTRYTKGGKIVRRNVTDKGGRGYGSSYARTLARTEVSRVHGQATIDMARDTPGVRGVRWQLSNSHVEQDECNDHASRSSRGMGPGEYLPDEVPRYPTHPNDLCALVPVVASRDEVIDEILAQYGEPPEPPRKPTAPVSDAFDLPAPLNQFGREVYAMRGDIDIRELAEDALGTINRVHRDGVLPRIPIEANFSQFSRTAGRFTYDVGGSPIKIGVDQQKQWRSSAKSTLTHEIGHFLDLSGIGTPGQWSSGTESMMDGWRNATRNSKSVQTLSRQAGDEYADYLLSNEELWARSYAQYIGTKSGDRTILDDLSMQRGELMPRQWTDDDFLPIMAAIDDLFRRLGWID